MLFPWQVAVMLAAGCVTLVLACVALTQKHLLVARPFALGSLLAACWCFLCVWMLQTRDLEERLLILKLGYMSIVFTPVVALEVTYRFVHGRKLLHGWALVAALIVPAVTAILAWTINHSPILRYDCWLDYSQPLPLLRFKSGPWNAVFYLYAYGLMAWSLGILLHSFRSISPWEKRARILFIVARLIPLVFDLLFHFRVLPPVGLNYAPASVALSGLLLSIIFFGDRMGYRSYLAHSTLVEKISDLLVVLDRDHRVLDMNRAAATALGVRLADMRGHAMEEVFAAWKDVPRILRGGAPVAAEIERDGRCFELTAIPAEEAGRDGTSIVWLRDITRRKQAERDYIVAAASAREANIAKDRYLAVMSHEIRSPLNSVLGFMRLLENTPLNAEQREYVEHIARDGDNLLAVINEILDFSKIEAGHMQLTPAPFHLREEVRNLCGTMELQALARGLNFSSDVADDVPAIVTGDKARVTQILRNLLVNAIKFTAEGAVSLRIDAKESPAGDCLLRFVVRDTGIGIAPADLGNLFQPFSQASARGDRHGEGTGLGLVIARRFSELMGGTITVESTPGEGSTFTCLLRLGLGGKVRAEVPAGDVLPRREILVVDDQPVNCRLLQLMLGQMNQHATTAASGEECLEFLRKNPCDIVIMDVEMPGLDGFETARRIRGLNFPAPASPYIIALTAHASTDIREQCFAAGMNDYLAKPISPPALKKALAAAEPVPRRAQPRV